MATYDTQPGILETVRNIIVTYKSTVGDPVSIADISKIARIEPITLISSNLTGTKELYTILHGVLNIYAAYYLQAINILAAQLVDVKILKILDKTNPDRDIKTLLTSGYTAYESFDSNNIKTLALENCKYRLPMLESDKNNEYTVTLEGIFDDFDDLEDKPLSTGLNKLDTFEKLGSAVGKVLNVKFSVRDNNKNTTEVSIPVVVKLSNMIIPGDVLDAILVSNKTNIRLGSRFKDAISGRISFIKDFILASDLIKTQKRTMIKDPTGYYNQLLKRVNNSRLYSALSGNISLAGISSIVVISEEDENAIKKHIGGNLTNQATRDIIFDNTSAMMIVLVDREWERVSIFVKDIPEFAQNSFEDFKRVTDRNTGMIMDMFKSLNLNNPPVF